MGRGEEVGARRQAAQIESNREVGVKSLAPCNSMAGRFFREPLRSVVTETT